MSDTKEPLPPVVNPAAKVIRLVIEAAPATGEFNVQAPSDPIMCYGMLEIARQVIARRSSGEVTHMSYILRI